MSRKHRRAQMAARTIAAPRMGESLQRPTPMSRYADSAPGYRGAGASSMSLFGWSPALRDPVDDTWEAWVEVTAKTIDAIHNNGWISGGVDQAVAQMVGAGLALNLTPEIGILGNADVTEEWARGVERRFEAWARDAWSCDLGGRYSLHQLADQGVRQYFATGEMLATVPWVDREGSSHSTKVNVMPSSRLSQASNTMRGIVQGVQLDAYGAAIGYEFILRDLRTNRMESRLVKARDKWARPVVIHLLNGAPTAVRGITPLAPALQIVRQLDQLADATLTGALIKAIFAATIESDAPTADVMKALQDADEQEDREGAVAGDFQNLMQSRFEWYKNTKIDLGNFGKIVHMFPGEKLNFNKSDTADPNYEPFTKTLLREIARCLGITYEQLTGDYVGATYSSLRMASADMWLINLMRRATVPVRFYQAVFEAWLEEDIEKGGTEFPGGIDGYLEKRRQVAIAQWRGPPKPSADELKTTKAQQIQVAEGWVTREQVSAEYGNDWRDVDEQQGRELKSRDKEGLLPPEPVPAGGGPDGNAAPAKKKPANPAVDSRLVEAIDAGDQDAVNAILSEDYGYDPTV